MYILVRNSFSVEMISILLPMQNGYETGINHRLNYEKNTSGNIAGIGANILDPSIGVVKESFRFEDKKRSFVCNKSLDYHEFQSLEKAAQTAEVGRALIDCIVRIPASFMSADTKGDVIAAINETCIDLGGGPILDTQSISALELHSEKQERMAPDSEQSPQFIIQYKMTQPDQMDQILDQFSSLNFDDFLDYDGHDQGIGKLNLFFFTENSEESKKFFLELIKQRVIDNPSAMAICEDGDYRVVYPDSHGEFEIF